MAHRRKRNAEEDGTGYSWMDTYGDLVTNLLCFFVLLYAFSSVDESKWSQLVESFSGEPTAAVAPAFDVTFARAEAITQVDTMVDYESRDEDDGKDAQNQENVIDKDNEENDFDILYKNILDFIEENKLHENLSVLRTEDVITIRFGEVFLFESGKAKLISDGEDLLEKIVVLIHNNSELIKNIAIEGHTDNVPIHSSEFNSNWELSTARAVNTLQKVLEFDLIAPKMLTASGCGEYWPVATNETAVGRSHNRRVDIVIEKITED